MCVCWKGGGPREIGERQTYRQTDKESDTKTEGVGSEGKAAKERERGGGRERKGSTDRTANKLIATAEEEHTYKRTRIQ